MRKQNEKQKKTIDIIRSTNERMSSDLEHYKKLSLKGAKKMGEGGVSQRNSLNPMMPPPSTMIMM
jgi:hypothetical protein